MRYWIGFVGVMLLVGIGGMAERGYIDWLGMGAMLVLAIPTALALKKGV